MVESRTIWRWLRAGIGLAVVGYAAWYLARNWEELRASPLEWSLSPLPIIASVLLVLATYAMLVEGWRRMVAGWGAELAWWPAARVWVLSSMGKYLPFKVWAIAGMAVLGKEAGVPPGVATASAVVLQIVSIGTGALVVALTGSRALATENPEVHAALVGLAGVAVGSLIVVLWPRPLNWLLTRLGGAGNVRPPAVGAVLVGVLVNALAWVLYGVALYALAHGVFAESSLTVVQAVGAFTASYLAGFLALLAPGGFGVRESVFVLLTQSSLGLTQAAALAVVSRIALTIADLLAAAPFVVARRRDRAVTER